MPARRAASASVTGPDLGLADALATALVVAGHTGLRLIDAIDGYEGFVISLDGTWQWTDGFAFTSSDARATPSLGHGVTA